MGLNGILAFARLANTPERGLCCHRGDRLGHLQGGDLGALALGTT
jgi:hypothetical protein